MPQTPISKPAKPAKCSLLKLKARKKAVSIETDLGLQFEQIQKDLKLALVTLTGEADVLSPRVQEGKIEMSPQRLNVTGLLALESAVDEELLECMRKVAGISLSLRQKAFLAEGLIF